MASKIGQGNVSIDLNGQELTLRPTMRAMNMISTRYSGLTRARIEVANENIDAIAYVIRHGAGMNDKEAKDLGERIFENGLAELLGPLINYVAILANGGKPLTEPGDDDDNNRSDGARPLVQNY